MPHITDLIAALRHRWRLEVAIGLITVFLVGLWTAATPKVYDASSSLLFNDTQVNPVTDASRSSDDDTMLATQIDVIKSESLAADVSRSLQLETPAADDAWRRQTGGVGDFNVWRGKQLLPHLIVEPGKGSRVLTIHYRSPDSATAAALANAFASAYLAARLRETTDPARTYSRWFEDRTREVRDRLEKAQAALTAYQRKTGIVDTGEVNAENNRLGQLSGQLTGAEGASADANARAKDSASESLDVQNSGVVQGLRAQIAAKSAQLSQMSSELGPNHPDRIAAQAELSALKSKLASEVAATTNSVRVASQAATSREADLRNRLDSQRGKMLGLAGDRAQLDVLQHDVDSSRAAYDAVTLKLGTMRLESETPTSNARQLDYATPPGLPAIPNVPLRALLSVILGGVLAIGAALALEWWRPRVRTSAGFFATEGVPVISEVTLKRSLVAQLLTTEGGL